jgi:hypothetical protein
MWQRKKSRNLSPSSDEDDYLKEEIDYEYLDRVTPPESPKSDSDEEDDASLNDNDDDDMDWPPPDDIDETGKYRLDYLQSDPDTAPFFTSIICYIASYNHICR